MPEGFWGSRCCNDADGKKWRKPKIRVPSVPVYQPVHLYTWYTYFQSTLFYFSNPHGTALFCRVKIKSHEIRKVLFNSISKIHGIKMVEIVNRVYGFMGYITISTQILRNRKNGRCHS